MREATENHVFDFGCVSHIANLCANSLTKALHYPVEDLLVDTYYFFHGSSKRREKYKESQLFTGVEMEDSMFQHTGCLWSVVLVVYSASGMHFKVISIVIMIVTGQVRLLNPNNCLLLTENIVFMWLKRFYPI